LIPRAKKPKNPDGNNATKRRVQGVQLCHKTQLPFPAGGKSLHAKKTNDFAAEVAKIVLAALP
jgi:predicted alpha/beta-hydrolase family hydrolase